MLPILKDENTNLKFSNVANLFLHDNRTSETVLDSAEHSPLPNLNRVFAV